MAEHALQVSGCLSQIRLGKMRKNVATGLPVIDSRSNTKQRSQWKDKN